MLAEITAYATSMIATPKPFRQHLGPAIGLWARGRRQQVAWARHIARTNLLLRQSCDAQSGQNTVVILGSGPLFDVPLDALAQKFSRVLLVDIAHLAPARRHMRNFANVEPIWRDLCPAKNPAALDFLHAINGLDWVVSLNLVSQLAAAVSLPDQRGIIDAHLEALLGLDCPVSLATDLSCVITDRSGQSRQTFDLLADRPMPPAPHRWTWEVAPFGEDSRKWRRTHDMAFYPDWKAAYSG
ncbi:hypothetical protein PSQ90_10075 [Devosia rhodophyticola]|uniref:Class I SAM-dependent methyltransferase n=1 Tax=Devosia rhodophyticola TaxID=3026423 RepID=A0ABY7YTF8_9HYPH|nr:hypothetical protein [Devosia rhodophyticola]WDR04671.1 hypothetical protein PSQ90_10075 [Devosia rhodophyticola]